MATQHTKTLKSLLESALSIPNDEIHKRPYVDSGMADRCVGMWPSGDVQRPGQFLHGSESERAKAIQVRNRARTFKQAESDARDIEDALDFEQPAGYLAVYLRNSVNWLQTDDGGRHEFSANVTCWIIE